MAFYDPLLDPLKAVSPKNLKRLSRERLSDLLDAEAGRAKKRLEELQQRYPSAGPRELAQRCIDAKKQIASTLGGVTGLFGVVTVPVDLLGMAYLQLSLLVEVATVFKQSAHSEREKQELLDLFGYANGIGPIKRAGPRVLGSLTGLLLTKGGLKTLGRAMPLAAAPISAYLNNQHIQKVGDAAVRHYDGWVHAHEKTKKASGG